MSQLTLDLPDELHRKLVVRAAQSGHTTVEQYVHSLIRADANEAEDESLGGPDHLTVTTNAELERLLLERLDERAPGIEATPELWASLKERARGHRAGRTGAGK